MGLGRSQFGDAVRFHFSGQHRLRLPRALPAQGPPKRDGQCNTPIETQALLALPIVRACAAHATGGSEEARRGAGLRPPPKLHVQFSRMQLSRRLSHAEMQEKESTRSSSQAHTHRTASWREVASTHHLTSRRVLFHPCASLRLHLHQVVKGTLTLELSNMLGTPKKEGRSRASLVQFCLG